MCEQIKLYKMGTCYEERKKLWFGLSMTLQLDKIL